MCMTRYSLRGVLAGALALLLFSGCSNPDKRLQEAAATGNTANLQAALEEGAKVEASDESGRTALMIAVESGKPDIMRLLLAHDANPNTPDKSGKTPLMVAARAGSIELVETLCEKGAKMTLKDSQGMTPAMHAKAGGQDQIARYLESPFASGVWEGKTPEGDVITFTVADNRLAGQLRVQYSYTLKNPYGEGILFTRCRPKGQPSSEDRAGEEGIVYSGSMKQGSTEYSCSGLFKGGRVQGITARDGMNQDLSAGSFEIELTDNEMLMNYALPFQNEITHREMRVSGKAHPDGSVSGTLEVHSSEGSNSRKTAWQATRVSASVLSNNPAPKKNAPEEGRRRRGGKSKLR